LQPYWWSENERSSPARAMVLAHELFDLLYARCPHLWVTEEDTDTSPSADGIEDILGERVVSAPSLQEMFRLRDEALLKKAPTTSQFGGENEETCRSHVNKDESCVRCGGKEDRIPALRSVYKDLHREDPSYTNWTSEFSGTLDYVFVSEECHVLSASVLPSSLGIEKGKFTFNIPMLCSIQCSAIK